MNKENRTGRKRYDSETLLKVILFSFMERGYVSTREIEKLCKTDIRFMWLLQEEKAPDHMTIYNFMNHCLVENIENIFGEINAYIFDVEFEIAMISCGFNLHKYYLNKSAKQIAA